ncbi:MAG: hypothetical protein ACRD1T_25965, partial [Acidimicrobiia bacterium]
MRDDVQVTAGVAVASYLARSVAADYSPERADVGPLVWRGEVPGLYSLRDVLLKAPDDVIPVTLEHEPPRRGEIDILVALDVPGSLPRDAGSPLRSIALALLALINLRLHDHLVPCAPFQVSAIVPGGRQFDNSVTIAVERRDEPAVEAIQSTLNEFHDMVLLGPTASKLQTALELYGAQSFERDSKVRFLLLVMAMECLATRVVKHPVALRLIAKWQSELTSEKHLVAQSSPEFVALESLERELLFRRHDSIRGQVRRLMSNVSEFDKAKADLPGRAAKVYDKRSLLVHDGQLPSEELVELEREARELVEAALVFV